MGRYLTISGTKRATVAAATLVEAGATFTFKLLGEGSPADGLYQFEVEDESVQKIAHLAERAPYTVVFTKEYDRVFVVPVHGALSTEHAKVLALALAIGLSESKAQEKYDTSSDYVFCAVFEGHIEPAWRQR